MHPFSSSTTAYHEDHVSIHISNVWWEYQQYFFKKLTTTHSTHEHKDVVWPSVVEFSL